MAAEDPGRYGRSHVLLPSVTVKYAMDTLLNHFQILFLLQNLAAMECIILFLLFTMETIDAVSC